MARSKMSTRGWVLIFALVILLIACGYYLYKRTASADVSGSIPSWIDQATKSKLGSWSAGQAGPFYGCTSNGYPVKSTLTASEAQEFGANSVVFEGQNRLPTDTTFNSQFYQSKYRLIITPLLYKVAGSQTTAKFRFTVTNPSGATNHMKLAQIRLDFWHVENYDTYTNGSPHYFAADQTILINGGNAFDLTPGQKVSVESNQLTMTSESYYTVDLASELYGFKNDALVWTGSGSASPVFCVVNPISISALKALNLNTIVTASPTVVPTKTVTPTPAPSITSINDGGVVNVNYDFHKGFTTFGAATAIASSKFADSSLYLYKFDGANNKWIYWPGMAQFTTEWGKGYYVYSKAAKTVSLPFKPIPTNDFSLTKGWNLLYNIGDKTLTTLRLSHNGVSKPAQEMISNGTIYNKVFVIDNDQATASCSYFKLIGTAESAANCTTGTLGTTAVLQSGKTFWVYVK